MSMKEFEAAATALELEARRDGWATYTEPSLKTKAARAALVALHQKALDERDEALRPSKANAIAWLRSRALHAVATALDEDEPDDTAPDGGSDGK